MTKIHSFEEREIEVELNFMKFKWVTQVRFYIIPIP